MKSPDSGHSIQRHRRGREPSSSPSPRWPATRPPGPPSTRTSRSPGSAGPCRSCAPTRGSSSPRWCLLHRPGPPGPDPQPAERRHRQLDRSTTPVPARPLRLVDRRPRPWPGRSPATSPGCSCFETAYDIEFDLRNIIYEHLTKMSFSFYDRVQSGQLISRANSDIRSVQMYMTFAPSILVQCCDRRRGLRLHAVHQRAAGLRGHGHHAVRLPGRRADAEVDVPGVVAHPVPAGRRGHHRRRERQRRAGGQVLRRRAAAAAARWPGRPSRLRWGYIKDADLRARFTPTVQNLPQVGLALVLLFGGYMVIHGAPAASGPSWPSTPTC